MTTLFLVQDAPFPPRSGSPLRAWQNVNVLAKFGPVHVFSVGKREADATMPGAASWTHVDANDFPVRTAGTVARLRRSIWPREFPIENDFAGVAINRRLRDVLLKVKPDAIVISHWHTALPRALRDRHVLVADAHNVESDVATRTLGAPDAPPSWRARYQIAQWRRRERSYLRGVDRIWATSDRDAAALRAAFAPLPPIDVLPNAIDLDAYAQLRARERSTMREPTIGYVGFYGYRPNADAAAALLDTIFPAVRLKASGARLVLVGRAPTERMLAAAEHDPQIVVTGAIDDVRTALAEIDVLAVPLRHGSGTRLKILEAFAARIPVITTAKGIEGIAAVSGIHAEVCEIAEMPDRCLQLIDDAARCRRLADAAFALVMERYSWSSLASCSAIASLLAEVASATA